MRLILTVFMLALALLIVVNAADATEPSKDRGIFTKALDKDILGYHPSSAIFGFAEEHPIDINKAMSTPRPYPGGYAWQMYKGGLVCERPGGSPCALTADERKALREELVKIVGDSVIIGKFLDQWEGYNGLITANDLAAYHSKLKDLDPVPEGSTKQGVFENAAKEKQFQDKVEEYFALYKKGMGERRVYFLAIRNNLTTYQILVCPGKYMCISYVIPDSDDSDDSKGQKADANFPSLADIMPEQKAVDIIQAMVRTDRLFHYGNKELGDKWYWSNSPIQFDPYGGLPVPPGGMTFTYRVLIIDKLSTGEEWRRRKARVAKMVVPLMDQPISGLGINFYEPRRNNYTDIGSYSEEEAHSLLEEALQRARLEHERNSKQE